jgi:hypothetical protein
MNKGRVGEERGSKEMNGCPLTVCVLWIGSPLPLGFDQIYVDGLA